MRIWTPCERIQSIRDKRDHILYSQWRTFIHGQWNKLSTLSRIKTNAINEKWYDRAMGWKTPSQRRVVKGFMNVVKKMYGSTKEASNIRSQFSQFSLGQVVSVSRATLRNRHKNKDPMNWWRLHSVCYKL